MVLSIAHEAVCQAGPILQVGRAIESAPNFPSVIRFPLVSDAVNG